MHNFEHVISKQDQNVINVTYVSSAKRDDRTFDNIWTLYIYNLSKCKLYTIQKLLSLQKLERVGQEY